MSTETKSMFDCWDCYPRLCRCECEHGVLMSMECADCKRTETGEAA
ncbi:MAG: hypothetical protein WC322_02805 [Candidatus Paceibacterota bacterium]|jgi:hypothetical protein